MSPRTHRMHRPSDRFLSEAAVALLFLLIFAACVAAQLAWSTP